MPVVDWPKDQPPSPHASSYGRESLRLAWKKTLRLQCPHCGEQHKVSVRDAFLELGPARPTRSDGARQAACCYVVLTKSTYCAVMTSVPARFHRDAEWPPVSEC